MENLVLLGAGPSCGLPQLSHILEISQNVNSRGGCSVCRDLWQDSTTQDRRFNVSALLTTTKGNVLIDMGKTCRQALLKACKAVPIPSIDAVLLTHDHADAMGGLDDLREFKRPGQTCIPVFASAKTIERVRAAFPWIVPDLTPEVHTNVGEADLRSFEDSCGSTEPGCKLEVLKGIFVHLIPVLHGGDYITYGFVFGETGRKVLYISDLSWIPDASVRAIDRLGPYNVMIIDSLMYNYPNYSHCSVKEILTFVDRWRPRNTYIVGLNCCMSFQEANGHLEQELKALKSKNGSRPSPLGARRQNQQIDVLTSIPLPKWRPPAEDIEGISLAFDGLKISL